MSARASARQPARVVGRRLCRGRQRQRVRPARAEGNVSVRDPPPALADTAGLFEVRDATDSGELLSACAALRVQCFYRYPGPANGQILIGDAAERAELCWLDARRRSEEVRDHKMSRLGMRVTCLAVVAPAEAVDGLADRTALELHGAGVAEEHMRTACGLDVVGTLDIHRGERLPGEILEGDLPRASGLAEAVTGDRRPPPAAALSVARAYASSSAYSSAGRATSPGDSASGSNDIARAYIFNVCVSPAYRRLGIGSLMLRHAHEIATRDGVEMAYVHCEVNNPGAKLLYEREGYVFEKEESEWLASKLNRPRRILMRIGLAAGKAVGEASE